MTIVIAIVPRLPPATDGVGDYSLLLAQEVRRKFGVKTHFIVCDPDQEIQTEIDGFLISQLAAPTPSDLISCLQNIVSQHVFLHYVGYGYEKWGCPTWLIKGLIQWRSQFPYAQIWTMFHELYALSGYKPWKHNFWNSYYQKDLAKQLARLSDNTVTSRQAYAEKIDGFREGSTSKTPFFPVFSTVGEPKVITPWEDRLPYLVIFGQALNKRRVYEEGRPALESICEQFGIQAIFDVGPKTGLHLEKVGNIPVRESGKCSIEDIDKIFQKSKLGFFNYNPDYLAKSTIFAAYCAYGLLPVSPFCSTHPIDGLTPGEQYWVIDQTTGAPQSIAQNAQDWYQSHSLIAQSHYFTKFLHID